MPARCYCGCGQAPASTCRQRLLVCDGCGVKARMARSVIATVVLSCSCGGTLQAPCLDDRATAGDERAELEILHMDMRSSAARVGGLRSAEVRRARRESAQLTRAERIALALQSPGGMVPGSYSAGEIRAVEADLPF